MIFKASVLILTQNRPQILKKCLASLIKQTVLPDQIVVVDNGSGEKTEKAILEFKKKIKIDYFQEKIKGEAFSRNRALKLAKGDILIFIDDDCVADKNWVENIINFFQKNPKPDGIVGRVENLLRKNIYTNIYQCYYWRWLMENFKNFNQVQPLTLENTFFDTKNLAFKRAIVKNFSFDPDVLFHGVNVDSVAGETLVKKGNFFYYPQMIVFHQNWGSFKELLVKNFYQGVADEWICRKQKIENRDKPLNYSYWAWLRTCQKEIENLNFQQKLIFWLMLFLYPLPYKIGRMAYSIEYFKVKKFQ